MNRKLLIATSVVSLCLLAFIVLAQTSTIQANLMAPANFLPVLVNEPTYTPTPTATYTPSPTFTPSPTPSPTMTPTPSPTPAGTAIPSNTVLENGSFEEGWSDINTGIGGLINQIPNGWQLYWVPIGQQLWDTGVSNNGVPESLHKLASQLPPNEQIGEPGALLLNGTHTYKVFHGGSNFGGSLTQTVTGLPAGKTYRVSAPVLMVEDIQEDFGAASGLWVNGSGEWVWDTTTEHRVWYTHSVDVVVPADGTVTVELRVVSKFLKKDFFIDLITMVPID